MNEEEGIAITEGQYITLTQAADILGYRGTGNLRKAIKDSRLRSIKPGPRLHLTTRAWLEDYAASLQHDKGGRPRGPRRPLAQQPPSQEQETP